MPVFDDSDVDVGGVDDRRGRSGAAIGGGAGIVGLLVFLLVQFLGGDAALLDIPGDAAFRGTGETLEQVRERCNAEGAIERDNDCYLIKVYNEINEVWEEAFDGYERPRLAFFDGSVATGCGNATSDVGPFYCPPDEEIYIDIGFLNALQDEFGASGRYAQAYVLAHEVGHHLQTITGIEERTRQAQQRDPSRANQLSVALELQADCLAGVWSRLADDAGNVAITEAELQEALEAAAAIGDDRIQKKTEGRVDPESWTHGSSEQRRGAFLRGVRAASFDGCR